MEEALGGSSFAEEALYRRYAGKIANVAGRVTGSREAAADILQETFLEAFTTLAKIRDPALFPRWLTRIAIHRSHRFLRRRSLRLRLGFVDTPADVFESSIGSDAPQEQRAELRRLDRALDRLAPVDRSAWVLRHVEGYGLREVAALSGCSLSTVKRRLARAQRQVEAHVADVRRGE